MTTPKRATVLWFGSDSAGTLSGQMARHRAALQGAEAARAIHAARVAEAADAARVDSAAAAARRAATEPPR